MKFSLCIATFLVPFLILDTIFATRMDSPNAIFLQNHVGIADVHHQDHDQLDHGSTSVLFSEIENKMENQMGYEKSEKEGNRRARTLHIAGSRLPDCLNACGSCSPCRLITISLACGSHTNQAESCPMSYRCMCNSKSYPIP